ncbi:hypothetical protein BH09MYX1_BH09MYX1_21300 [soil metagenome]
MTTESPPSSRSPESYARMATPLLRSAWLLYAATIVSTIAVVLGGIIAPGVRGVASDKVVSFWQTSSATFVNASGLLLIGLLVLGIFEFLVDTRVSPAAKGAILFGSAGVVMVAALSFVYQMAPAISVLLVGAVALVACVSGSLALRATHTRAGGLILVLLAVSGLLRLVAWRIAVAGATEPGTYDVARGFETAAVVFEGFAQAGTVVWVGMRGRWVGQLTTPLALAGAFFLVWSAGQGRADGAPQWKMALWGALGWLPPPEPYAISTLSVFFGVSAPLLALAALIAVRGQGAISAAVALAILSRGAVDVPLRGLLLCAASIWMVLAMVDDRAMWRGLVEEKKKPT